MAMRWSLISCSCLPSLICSSILNRNFKPASGYFPMTAPGPLGSTLCSRTCPSGNIDTLLQSGSKLDIINRTGGIWNWHSILTKPVNVEKDALPNFCSNFLNGGPSRDTSWKIRNVSRIISLGFLDDYGISHFGPHPFSPACLRILAWVPGAKSSLGFPGTVTRPFFDWCLYCRWPPRWAAGIQPSSASNRRTSETFMGAHRLEISDPLIEARLR